MKRIIILGAVVGAVVLAWTAGWFFVAGQVRDTIAALGTSEDPDAATFACERLDVGGYPFRFDVTCTGALVASGDVTASISELRATLLVYRPSHLQVFAQAPAALDDAFTGARSRIEWDNLDASVRLTDWRIARVSLVADNLAWVDTLSTEALIASAGRLEVHFADVPADFDPSAGTATMMAHGTLAGLGAPGPQINAGEAEIEARLTEWPADVRTWGDGDLLRRWQASGGRLLLEEVRADDEPNFVEATGAISLDASGRPEGQVEITSRGLVERLEPFVPENVRGLMLGQKAADGSYRQVITMQSGVVLSGIMPAGMLVPLW